MKKFFKNEDGFLPFPAAIFIAFIATSVAAGVIDVKHPQEPLKWEKLKTGTPEYKVNP